MTQKTATESVSGEVSGGTRFDGPEYLTRFEPDPDAINRLKQIPSETAYRLVKYATGGWPGMLSGEDFLAPITAAEGDVVLRVVAPPGSNWVWWRGNPLGNHYYGRIHCLPHYQDHKVTGRRKANADTLAESLKNKGSVIPVHVDNVPEPVWECMKNDDPYCDRERANTVEQGETA